MAKSKRPRKCKTCDYIRAHRGPNRVNEDLVNGVTISAIMQRTGLGRGTLTRHRDEGHMMKGHLAKAGYTKGAKEQLDLMKCQKKVWDDAQEAVDLALGRKAPPKEYPMNLSVFGQCIAPMTKIMEVLAKAEPEKKGGDGPKESAFWMAYGERAKVVFDGKQT